MSFEEQEQQEGTEEQEGGGEQPAPEVPSEGGEQEGSSGDISS
jgi:hypothetical protein